MSEEKCPLTDFDDICFRLSCGVALIGAVHECIEHGDFKSESYADALFGAYDYLGDLAKEMREVVDSAYASARNGKENTK